MHVFQVQAKLTDQQARTKEAEDTIETLKKENGVMKGHGVKLKNAQKEIERLREAWTDKDVQLAEANSSASQQRHVRSLRHSPFWCPKGSTWGPGAAPWGPGWPWVAS